MSKLNLRVTPSELLTLETALMLLNSKMKQIKNDKEVSWTDEERGQFYDTMNNITAIGIRMEKLLGRDLNIPPPEE